MFQFLHALLKLGAFCTANSMFFLNSSYSVCRSGRYNVTPQVLAVRNCPAVNSMPGLESKPSGGGCVAPVAKTKTSDKLMAASPSKMGRYFFVLLTDFSLYARPKIISLQYNRIEQSCSAHIVHTVVNNAKQYCSG